GWLPSPRTLLRGIEKLAPGERLRWSAGKGIKKERYWTLPEVAPVDGDRAEFAAKARELYIEAVAKYVRGLDEVGLFLSGGMDSTIMLIALKELGVPRIRTFTLGLPGDEKRPRDLDIPYPRLVAERYGAEHQELYFREPFDPAALLPGVMAQYDDPILTPNCYTKYLLAAMAARSGVSSVLTGSGAGGGCGPYRRFRDPSLRRRVLKKIRGIDDDTDRFVRLRAKLFERDEITRLIGSDSALSQETIADYLGPYLDQVVTDDYPRSYLIANLLLTCPEKACAVLDRSGMMASVDVRSPHLDRALIEFQMTMPHSFDGGESFCGIKCLLEDAYIEHMPSEVLDRQETGFPSYYRHQGELESMQRRLFAPETLDTAGMFDSTEVERIVAEERRDTESKSVGKRSWVLTQLCVWHAMHVNRDSAWAEAAAHASPEPLIRAAV
ncbi:MAG: asparagine synthase-related protein, partial [Planctomycetota bacterium]